ncbi:UPF0158 family protein [Bacillus sp. Marseille-P3661]|uniref:UPF0158 family protein n=1 Tax=Bacillus sp. Marseille-P3661 TaxID=1936234 RepID=UPI000C81DF07|nr:UPF0158 family protein [Bacillus sp. Marseille-P3661]
MQVKLEDIIEGMEMQSEETISYLNLETGELVYVSREALLIAEDGEDYDHLPEWQQEIAKIAYDIVDSLGKYAELPTKFEIDDYEIMERFCYSISDDNIQGKLLNAIKGKGAFRRFRDSVEHLGIINQWYTYRDISYKEIAREFCVSKNIGYIE